MQDSCYAPAPMTTPASAELSHLGCSANVSNRLIALTSMKEACCPYIMNTSRADLAALSAIEAPPHVIRAHLI